VLAGLPGAKVSGSKGERIERVIEYFDKMVFRDVPDEAPPGEIYFQYLVELARRDREILLANGVIRKDREMDAAFEAGTRHLFVEKLGLELIAMGGSAKGAPRRRCHSPRTPRWPRDVTSTW